MTAPNNELLQAVMQACVQSAPQPVYPKELTERLGVDRSAVDAALDRLRLGGALQLTEWVAGKGQGYVPTETVLGISEKPVVLRMPAPRRVERVGGEITEYERGEQVRSVFEDPRPGVLWKILIALNVAVFVVGLALGEMRGIPSNVYLMRSTQDLQAARDLMNLTRDMGSLDYDDAVVRDEWWRLLTYQFLHGGIIHLASNMLGLYFFGQLLENMWGWKKFLAIYLYSGIAGGCLALIFSRSGLVGASAAIYGILTSLGVWVFLNRHHLGSELTQLMLRQLRNMLFLMVVISLAPGISMAGHVGGALGGALIAIPLQALHSLRDLRRPAVWLLPFVLVLPIASVKWASARDEQLPMERTDAVLLDVYNQILVPALKGRKEFENPEVARRATLLLPQASAVVKRYADELTMQERTAQGDLKSDIESRLQYLKAWQDTIATLGSDLKLTPAEREAQWEDLVDQIAELRHTVMQARDKVRKNKVLPPPPDWTPARD